MLYGLLSNKRVHKNTLTVFSKDPEQEIVVCCFRQVVHKKLALVRKAFVDEEK